MPLEWCFKYTFCLLTHFHSGLKETAYLCGAAVKLQDNRGERMTAVTGLRQRPKARGKWFLSLVAAWLKVAGGQK